VVVGRVGAFETLGMTASFESHYTTRRQLERPAFYPTLRPPTISPTSLVPRSRKRHVDTKENIGMELRSSTVHADGREEKGSQKLLGRPLSL
jgi:hypothetical protein